MNSYKMARNWNFVRLTLQVLILFEVSVAPNFSCPAQCVCNNVHVDCYGRGLKKIPEDIPPDTVYIDLQSNEIEVVDGEALQNLKEMQEISLRFNKIMHLPAGAFSDLPKLKHIHLGSNLLTSLTADIFANLPGMEILDLTENFLTSIDGVFDNIPTLTRLVVSKNSISALTEEALKPLTKLVYFMASDNNISIIAPTAFHSMADLSFLALSKNPLKSIDNVLSQNIHLSYLDLNECQLDVVPSGLPWATRHLQLGKNNITKLTKNTFMGTRYLGIIILDENQISEIESGTFLPIVHLQQLWLNGNKLTAFPSPIPPNVETLSLEKNWIAAITTDDFPDNSKLKLLSLKGNKIAEIGPFTFARLGGLQKLYLSGNAIAELKDRSFHGLRNLTELDIGRNPVTHIETRFAAGMYLLKMLDMSFIEDTEPFVKGNFFRDTPTLTSLDLRFSPFLARHILESNETLKSLWNLESLSLMDNGLEAVPPDLHRYFPNLKSIKLSGNMWRCDKQLLLLHDWMQRARDLFTDVDNVVCASPAHLMGEIIADLPMYAFYFTTTTRAATTNEEEMMAEAISGEGEMESNSVEFTVSTVQTAMTSSIMTTTGTELPTENSLKSFSEQSTEPSLPADTTQSASQSSVTEVFTFKTSDDSKKKSKQTESTILTSLLNVTTTSTASTIPVSKTAAPETTTRREMSKSTEVDTTTAGLTSTVTTTAPVLTTVITSSKSRVTSSASASPTSSTTTTPSSTSTSTPSNDTGQRSKVTSPSTTTQAGRNETGQRSSKAKGLTSAMTQPGTMVTTQKASPASTASVFSSNTKAYATDSERDPASTSKTSELLMESESTIAPTTHPTTTDSTETPTFIPTSYVTPNGDLRYGKKENYMPSVADATSETQTIITAISVTIILLILGVLVAAFIHRHRKKFRLMYHRSFSYTVEQSDTAFVLNDQDEPDVVADSTPQSRRSRSSQGSGGSRPSTDSSTDVETFRLLS